MSEHSVSSPSINYEKVFNALPVGLALVEPRAPDFRVLAANDQLLKFAHLERSRVIHQRLFDVFFEEGDDSINTLHSLRSSYLRVLETRAADILDVKRFDIHHPTRGEFEERYWSAANIPLFDDNGDMFAILHRTEDVTDYMKLKRNGAGDMVTRELAEKNERLSAELYRWEADRVATRSLLQHSEEALKSARASLSLALRASHLRTWSFDIQAQRFSWDDFVHLLFGCSSVALGRSYSEFLKLLEPEDAAVFPADRLDASSAHLLTDHEFRVRWPDGSLHYISFRGEQLSSDQLAGIALDVTNQKLLEQERLQALQQRAEALAEVDRQKNAFLGHISHEFRTPLTLMMAPLEDCLTDEGDPLPEKHRGKLKLVLRNACRVLRQVNQLLTFTRTQAACCDARFVPTDLSLLTADLASTFRALIESAGLEFIVKTPPLGEDIYIDHELYEKIVFNLLSNAFKFTMQGNITLAIQRHGDTDVELRISDTGVGIDPASLPAIFDRFHRGAFIGGRSYEGSGIGLALTKELVVLHGGTIRLESEVGKGTTFFVTFPIGYAHLPAERVQKRPPANVVIGASAPQFLSEATQWVSTSPSFVPVSLASDLRDRILVVDDNQDMRSYLAELLQPLGAVMTASNADIALQLAREHRPQLILLDVMMPCIDGFHLLQLLRKDPVFVDTPVILLSARASPSSRAAGLNHEANDYLVKPFAVKELLARVKLQLDLARSKRAVSAELKRRGEELNKRTEELKASEETVIQQAKEQLRMEGVLWAEEQRTKTLQECNKKQEDFMDTLCHELRNPLNGIIGTVDMLADCLKQCEGLTSRVGEPSAQSASLCLSPSAPPASPSAKGQLSTSTLDSILDSCQKCIKSLYDCCGHAKIILDDVLDVSRLDNRKVTLSPVPTVLSTLLTTTASMFLPSAKQKGIELEIRRNCPPDTCLRLDPHRLSQIIINLLSNAVKFTPPSGHITVTADFVLLPLQSLRAPSEQNQGTLSISVADSGPGMTNEQIAVLYDRFSQASLRVGASYGGSGLGLYISRSLIRLMGGDMLLSSRPGFGSCFTVTLPAQEVESAEDSKTRIQPISSAQAPSDAAKRCRSPASVSLLVVEDNRINQKLLQGILRKFGYHHCDVADNGQEAVTMNRSHFYDLIFMDIEMPVMDGVTATREIRKMEVELSRQRVPIVGVSGHTSGRRVTDATAAGMNEYITKPYTRDAVLNAVLKFTQRGP